MLRYKNCPFKYLPHFTFTLKLTWIYFQCQIFPSDYSTVIYNATLIIRHLELFTTILLHYNGDGIVAEEHLMLHCGC